MIYLKTSEAQTVQRQIVTDELQDKERRCHSLMEVTSSNLQSEMNKTTKSLRITCGLAYIRNGQSRIQTVHTVFCMCLTGHHCPVVSILASYPESSWFKS